VARTRTAKVIPINREQSSRLSKLDELILGLQTIRRTQPDAILSIEKDVLYVGTPSKTNPRDHAAMYRLNWFDDKEFDVWKKFIT
jgi:hypothetical protein